MYSHTGSEISQIILNLLEENDIQIQDFRGQSYDNATHMSGKYSGVKAILCETCNVAHYVPSTAHSHPGTQVNL